MLTEDALGKFKTNTMKYTVLISKNQGELKMYFFEDIFLLTKTLYKQVVEIDNNIFR